MRFRAAPAALVVFLTGCSPPSGNAVPPSEAVRPSANPPFIETSWLDPAAAQRIMAARADFDATELSALERSERVMGAYRHVMRISREQYIRHYGGKFVPIARSAAWLREHQRRAAYARSILAPEIAAARARLEHETFAALTEFFSRELRAGRIAKVDYRRYTAELGRGYFPGFRGRKWTGPPVYELRGADVSDEYAKILQEVRRLWQAQGRRASAIVWVPADQDFYRTLVPRSR